MVSGLLPLVSLWPNLGLFERSSENDDCLRLRVAGGEGDCSDSGRMTAEATALEKGMFSKAFNERLVSLSLQRCFPHDQGALVNVRCGM